MDRGFESNQECTIPHLIKFRLFQEQLFIIENGYCCPGMVDISCFNLYKLVITIICNIVMTITAELSAVGGSVTFTVWVWPDPKLCVICGNPMATSHIYASCGNVFPDKNVPFPWFPQTLKCLNLTFVYLWAWKIMARGNLSLYVCFMHFVHFILID